MLPFIGQISVFSFDFVPKGWAACDGAVVPISQNASLFALLGTTFGGNGKTTFALPDFQGRVPVHAGKGLVRGQAGGEVSHTLAVGEMPVHFHGAPQGSTAAANTPASAGAVLAAANNAYTAPATLVALAPQSITTVGGGQPHENMQPFLAMNFCIAMQGAFPSHQ